MITTEQIKELRDQTGVSVMQCKKALEEADGNMEKALIILKKKGADMASKRADREAHDGIVIVKSSGNKAALVVLNCETDFVARNDEFIALANNIADIALAKGKEGAEKEAVGMTNDLVLKIGENIKIGEIKIVEGSNLGVYVHSGKSGVITSLSGGDANLSRDIAMHIAAMKPEYLKREDVPENALAMATELFTKEVAGSDKPEEIKQKMLQGKIDTYFKEQTLLDQSFIKNPDITIAQLLKENGGATIETFVRYSLS
ncbi:MAG: translation elongation factor Ts [Candidatus Paceibacterota bacterium]|jgi:elongation factor Ts